MPPLEFNLISLPLSSGVDTRSDPKAHMQNFFDAIRGKAKLNCPAEVGFESAVTVLKVNEAIEAKQRLSFRPEDFKA